MLNNSTDLQKLELPANELAAKHIWTDLLTQAHYQRKDDMLELSLSGKTGLILK